MDFKKLPLEQRYGVYIGVATAIWIAFEYYVAAVLNRPDLGDTTGLLAAIIPVIGLSYGLQAKQKEKKKTLSYKDAVSTGAYISVVSGVISAIFVAIIITLVPSGIESYIEYLRTTLEQAGENTETIEQVVEGVRGQFNPALQAVYMLVGSVVAGVIISSIIWLFLRKKPLTTK